MLCCYVPETVPYADNPDRCQVHTLLYRRYILVVAWSGLPDAPHIDRAYVHDTADRYYVRVSPEHLTVLDRAAFSAWYDAHWQRFMRRSE